MRCVDKEETSNIKSGSKNWDVYIIDLTFFFSMLIFMSCVGLHIWISNHPFLLLFRYFSDLIDF